MNNYSNFTLDEFQQMIESEEMPIMVNFGTSWCGSCKKIEPLIDKVLENFNDKVKYCKINVEKSPELTKKYNVVTIPTVIFFSKGTITAKEIGSKTRAVYTSHLEFLTNTRRDKYD